MAEETGKLVIVAERGGSVAEISAFLSDLENAYLALYTLDLLLLPAGRWPLPYPFPPFSSPQFVPLTTDALPPNARLTLERVRIESPGIWEFLGSLNPLQQIREYLKDRHSRRQDRGVALLTGLRRGELFALRWKSFDEDSCCITVSEAVYEGRFGLPKTEAGKRRIPLSEFGCNLLHEWKSMARETNPDGLVFCTRSGKPISPNNVLRTWVFPACEAVNLPHATWLTFRRTYCSWAHDKNVPAKVVAELMGHSNVSTTLNVYTQVLHDSVRVAADRIGEELFSIVQSGEGTSELIH